MNYKDTKKMKKNIKIDNFMYQIDISLQRIQLDRYMWSSILFLAHKLHHFHKAGQRMG